MKYSARQVDTTDLGIQEQLRHLQKTCLPGDTLHATHYGHWWILYTESGNLAGFCGMVPSTRWIDCMYLCRAGVLNAHRGHGLQKKLIRVRLQKARALGMNWVISDTYDNPASANNLIGSGFKMFNPTEPWGAKGTLYWRKKILHAV